jgi:putative transposase
MDGSSIGVDFGVGDRFATMSDGTVIENPRFFRSAAKRLARAQKALTRKEKGSRNRNKARAKVARIHYRTACRRQDFVHKFTTGLSKTHARIVVEDLILVGMASRTGFKLGKSVYDVALSEARGQLKYKSSWYGTELIVADRWFPSSKTCSVCKAVNCDLKLSDRSWECSCGVTHDRDLNAARNLESLAGSSPVAACGDNVSPEHILAVVCEAGIDGREAVGDEVAFGLVP